jgi:hypothetical protein
MNLKAVILLACAYTTMGIRLIAENKVDCIVCQEFVPFLKNELNKNSTEVAILDHLEPLCGESKECQYLIPMIVNHCIDYLNYHSDDQLCATWC